MSIKNIIVKASFAVLLFSSNLEARLGENIKQTDERYGTPKFEYSKSGMAYRNYTFKNKNIEVIFSQNEAVFEIISFGPHRIKGNNHAQQIGSDNAKFISAIMTSAYNWPDDKVNSLVTNLGVYGKNMLSELLHEGVTARYYFDVMKLKSHRIYEGGLRLNSKKVDEEGVRSACGKIITEAYQAKNKSKAGGF